MILARRPRRRGTSLIEMVLVIAGVTTLITICGGVLHLVFRLEGAGRSALTDASNVARLSRQFRADVRGASAAKVVPADDDAPLGLDLSGEGSSIVTYRQADGQVLREEREGERQVHREAYAFGRLGPARFLVEPNRARLDLPRISEELSPMGRPGYTVEATLGKHRSGRERSAP